MRLLKALTIAGILIALCVLYVLASRERAGLRQVRVKCQNPLFVRGLQRDASAIVDGYERKNIYFYESSQLEVYTNINEFKPKGVKVVTVGDIFCVEVRIINERQHEGLLLFPTQPKPDWEKRVTYNKVTKITNGVFYYW